MMAKKAIFPEETRVKTLAVIVPVNNINHMEMTGAIETTGLLMEKIGATKIAPQAIAVEIMKAALQATTRDGHSVMMTEEDPMMMSRILAEAADSKDPTMMITVTTDNHLIATAAMPPTRIDIWTMTAAGAREVTKKIGRITGAAGVLMIMTSIAAREQDSTKVTDAEDPPATMNGVDSKTAEVECHSITRTTTI